MNGPKSASFANLQHPPFLMASGRLDIPRSPRIPTPPRPAGGCGDDLRISSHHDPDPGQVSQPRIIEPTEYDSNWLAPELAIPRARRGTSFLRPPSPGMASDNGGTGEAVVSPFNFQTQVISTSPVKSVSQSFLVWIGPVRPARLAQTSGMECLVRLGTP